MPYLDARIFDASFTVNDGVHVLQVQVEKNTKKITTKKPRVGVWEWEREWRVEWKAYRGAVGHDFAQQHVLQRHGGARRLIQRVVALETLEKVRVPVQKKGKAQHTHTHTHSRMCTPKHKDS